MVQDESSSLSVVGCVVSRVVSCLYHVASLALYRVLAFFFYETDTPARVVSLKKFIPLILFDWDSTVPLGF
jgi:hypothetical protein